ncbi:AGAP006568-PA-like protein [Anopheles sinensis]|uniref:AGAP006568-PA-like protein n=1 Tax=Anopheles sinensis TaxID=74873 RepID=A0A084WMQ0_ANOSI|nr:AGAP006568-PA-like protein [Anopheles sinensis]
MKLIWLVVVLLAAMAQMTLAFCYTEGGCSSEGEKPREHTCAPGHKWDGEKCVPECGCGELH